MIKPEEIRWHADGLIPAIIQDARTGEVLTLAYLSRESLAKTLELGETVFFSRSRQALWHKGDTSGHVQQVVGLAADCDRDAVLIRVQPRGPACHTGARTCFFEAVEGFEVAPSESLGGILCEIEQVIAERKAERPEGSYTVRLLDRGRSRILQKVGEEAVETVIAGMDGNREQFVSEAADLLFHLLVALQDAGVSTSELARELRARRISGQPAK